METKIRIKNIPEGYQAIITNGKHSLISDKPLAIRGTDMGLSPTESLLSGIATCTLDTIRHIARKNNWKIENIYAEFFQ